MSKIFTFTCLSTFLYAADPYSVKRKDFYLFILLFFSRDDFLCIPALPGQPLLPSCVPEILLQIKKRLEQGAFYPAATIAIVLCHVQKQYCDNVLNVLINIDQNVHYSILVCKYLFLLTMNNIQVSYSD
jgi:hypothetical protein